MCLEDGELLSLLHFAAQDFARKEVFVEVTQFFTLASMTAVRKPDGAGNCHWHSVSPSGGECLSDSTSRRLRRCAHHINSQCRPGQAQIAWGMQ